jgi:hypothetical protein
VEFNFQEIKRPEIKSEITTIKTTQTLPEDNTQTKEIKKTINFQELPKGSTDILSEKEIEEYSKEEQIGLPYDDQQNSTSYLSLVLSPNLRDLEMMIRGLEYVKRYNRLTKKEEIILRRIKDHPLNEYGINKIMSELKVYCSPEIKLGRKREKDYYNSVNHVCYSIVRLIYKNLKSFGMNSQEKQRNAKTFCNAIIEMIDASFSRSIQGKENDLSRATSFEIQGSIDSLQDPARFFNKKQKEEMKN